MSPIRVETGPMFSGKSGSLVERVKRRLIGKQEQGKDFLVYNHFSDTRYAKNSLAAHSGGRVDATPIQHSREILDQLFEMIGDKPVLKADYLELRALYIDEAQFFDCELGPVLHFIDHYFAANRPEVTLEIVVAGLDLDFRGEPFGPMPDIIARAKTVNKHVAVCAVCGEENATRTQRLVDGKPANFNDPIVLVGAHDAYTARCERHHEVPGRPYLGQFALGLK